MGILGYHFYIANCNSNSCGDEKVDGLNYLMAGPISTPCIMFTDNNTWKARLLFAAVAAAGSTVSSFATFSYISPPLHIKRRNTAFVVVPRSLQLPTRLYVSSAKDNDMITYSEEDIIRILRTTPRYYNNNNGEACHTVLDVLHIMSRYSHISIPNDSSELSSINTEQIIHDISPNIAVAALRRLTSSPFLPISFQTNKYRRQKKRNYKKVSTEERNIYDQLIHLLLNKVSDSIDDQLGFLRSTGSNNDNVHSKPPRLLSRKDTFLNPPSTNSVLNWYALADSLCSISNLASVLLGNNRHDDIIKGHLLTNISPTEQDSILHLFDSIIQYLSRDNRITSSFVRCIGPRRLIRDVLQPIVIIETTQRNKFQDIEDIIPVTTPYTQLIGVLSSYLVLPNALEKLSVSDISTALWHMTKIYSPYGQYPTELQSHQLILLRTFMKRVRKFNVRSSAEARDLVQIIWSVSRLMRYLIKQVDAIQPNTFMIEQSVLPLSIRLPGEDEQRESDNGVVNVQSQPKDQSSIPINILKEEAVTMFHTLVNEIVLPPFYSRRKNDNNNNVNNYQGIVEKVKLESLSLRQICDVLEAATLLGIEDITVSITKIIQYLVTSPSSPISRCRSCNDISRLLSSLQRHRVGSGIYNNAANSRDNDTEGIKSSKDITSTDKVELESQCVQLLGERFLDIILWRKEKSMLACSPKTLAVTLRSGVLMFQGNSTATRAMLNAAKILIVDEAINEEDDQDISFLDECNEFEVSNYLFAFAMAKQFDEDVFTALTDRMIEEDIISSCSPSSASRALWSCAMLMSLDDVDVKSKMQQNELSSGELFLHERLINLFHQLSPLLLSEASLSPTDISMAMWAMAKVGYIVDQGIFDELAQLMTMKLDHSNTRLVSQALWSCGKMIELEAPATTDDESDVKDEEIESEVKPPYVEYVDKYIRHLISNQDKMTPKHLTQSIWAMGRLRISNYYFIDEMANVAYQMRDSLNAREVANIVWGLMRVDYDDSKLVQHVINSPVLCKDCSAQDASTIMFVLGKLQIRDKRAFGVLGKLLKDKPDATTQSITNALWAHEVLRIPPPPALLMSWASTRLNLDVPDMKEE